MKYNVLGSALDSGGFGRVYLVEGEDKRRYAMKELKSPNVVNKKRFEREISILRQLNHPNIVKIIEWNTEGNPPIGPWYTMEYLGGGSLRNHMGEIFRDSVFSRKWTINTMMLPICDALQLAHNSGIYHRDLKPENIMYTSPTRNQIKVTDWGLGKDLNRESIALTAVVGGVGGTPGYCAPEQWFALDNVDSRADVFSLGVIFYEMMTGHRPVSYDNRMRRPQVDSPSKYHSTISPDLDDCVLKMIELQPESRHQSISELTNVLKSLPDRI